MIDYKHMRETIAKGLKDYLGVTVIRGNQSAAAPAYPYVSYNVTTMAGENNGTWQQHPDGIDRLMVKSFWSIATLSDDYDESVNLAIKAREWITHTGRAWLAERGITVQTCTPITNRDNILTVGYERKNGFDAVFYVFHEVDNPANTYGYIEGAEVAHEMTN